VSLSCSTLAGHILTPLSQRHLRISEDGPFTEYRWFSDEPCGFLKMERCFTEHVERDFDLSKPEDRKRFNDMGFDCSVRHEP